MAVSFSTKGLNSISSSNYTLEQFNGVDYTTTPTKVTDDKAIKISNYLPEGNSLVKRYGYTKIMNLAEDAFEDIRSKIWETNGNTAYQIEYAENHYRIVQFNNHLLLFIGRGQPSSGGKWMNAIVFFDVDNNGNLVPRSRLKILNGNYTPVRGVKCETGAISVVNNAVYAFVFNDYFLIEYKEDLFHINRLRLKNNETYRGAAYTPVQAGIISSYIENSQSFLSTAYSVEPYIPTLMLNYQPENGLGKALAFEQLNMLSPKFKIEFGVTLSLTKSGDTITSIKILNPNYNIKNILDREFYGGLYDDDVLLLVENESDTSGFGIYPTYHDGIMTLNVTETAQPYQDGSTAQVYQTKIPMDIMQGNYRYVKLTFEYRLTYFDMDDIMSAKRGCVYGVYNSADRIFVGNTDKAPNTDWHTLNDANGNPNFTYFGVDTYNAIGSSDSEIVGYSLLNDGSLAILKDPNDISNIFIRTGKIVTTNEEYTVYDYSNAFNASVVYNYVKNEEIYPTITSGLLIKTINKDTKFCLYDNKLIFNTEDGIYYLNLNSTTANQSYAAKELSYYIRDNLGKDISNSSIFTDGKYLYVGRVDKNGQFRVYVADKNKYGFVNSEEQYHWWVLDGLPAKEFFTFKNVNYFVSDDLDLYLLSGTGFVDYDYKTTTNVSIGGSNISADVAFDTDDNTKLIFYNDTPTWAWLNDIYKYNANIDKDNTGEKLEYIKKNISLKLLRDYSEHDVVMEINSLLRGSVFEFVNSGGSTVGNLDLFIDEDAENAQKIKDFIGALKGKTIIYAKTYMTTEEINGVSTQVMKAKYRKAVVGTILSVDAYNDNVFRYTLGLTGCADTTLFGETNLTNQSNNLNAFINSTLTNIYLLLDSEELKIKELYTSDDKALSDYFYIPSSGWYNATTGDFVSATLSFNIATFTLNKIDVEFYIPENSIMTYTARFVLKAPVETYWYGKYTDLGRYDILKTTKSIHFVPETRRGGYTQVGYRTRKTKTMNADTSGTYTLSKYLIDIAKERTTLSRYFVSNDLGINLSDVDFNNFSFESDVFARTYSSKKKIKNFSFIQLKFTSDTAEDSTIASVDIKYTYTKENKGVK